MLRTNPELTDWLTDRLLEVAATVPDDVDGFNLTDDGAVFKDERLYDAHSYPPEIWKKPGEKQPNRAAYGAWGAYVNAFARKEYGRPLFMGASADLAESTNLAGFGKDFGDMPGWGWYERDSNLDGHGPADADHRVRQRRARSSASPRSTWPPTRSTTSTASGARAQPTARSRTSSTGRCASSASSRRTAS